jgi:hypothetical protein
MGNDPANGGGAIILIFIFYGKFSFGHRFFESRRVSGERFRTPFGVSLLHSFMLCQFYTRFVLWYTITLAQ